jgi:taurine dioxygenase
MLSSRRSDVCKLLRRQLHMLIVDAYPKEARRDLLKAGVPAGSVPFERILKEKKHTYQVCYPADGVGEMPNSLAELQGYDGIMWSGSSLNVYEPIPEVMRQIHLATLGYEHGIPQWGSCWGLQIGATAAGNPCEKNPIGIEAGVANIRLTDIGKTHPMYAGKTGGVQGFQHHWDHVKPGLDAQQVRCNKNVKVLATNQHSSIQALDLRFRNGTFWGTQYHPEFSLADMAKFVDFRKINFINHTAYSSDSKVQVLVDSLEKLHQNPADNEVSARLGIDGRLFEPEVRLIEINNYLKLVEQSKLKRKGTQVAPKIKIQPRELLGADIYDYDLANLLDDPISYQQINRALLQHQVLFFHNQTDSFTPSAHLKFASQWGSVQAHPAYQTVPGFPEITVLESDATKPSLIEEWHTDMTYLKSPPLGSVLFGCIIPQGYGDTEFLSLSAAYNALPEEMQNKLLKLNAEHSFAYGFRHSLAEPGGQERLGDVVKANPPVVHPVVRQHPESGQLGLFVNRLFTTKILGLNEKESSELLKYLYSHIEQEKFITRLQWKPGTVAFWDNRITQHRPVNNYFPRHRKLQRITINGDMPFLKRSTE